MSKVQQDPDHTVTADPVHQAAAAPIRYRSVLIVEGSCARTYPLPPAGKVVIGRGERADLRLEDQTASREHALLTVSDRDVQVADSGSRNGTFVNGEKVGHERTLRSGDVITISKTSLVYLPEARRRAFCELDALRQRLAEEVDRAHRHQCPVTVLWLLLGSRTLDRPQVESALVDQLRLFDIAAFTGGAELVVLLPEVTDGEATERASLLLTALGDLGARVKAGVASWPADGDDAETLLVSARWASDAAEAGEVKAAADRCPEIAIDGRTIIVADPIMVLRYERIRQLAQSHVRSILIQGETGTGKELAALAFHYFSSRKTERLEIINCGGIPNTLIEGELFGHERGAFTGAVSSKPGLMEVADRGTVFLDELADLSREGQTRLLRVLQDGKVRRVGAVHDHDLDVRIVAATNRDLKKEVQEGRFREDLYYRLVETVELPPLRERRREIPILLRAFLKEACAKQERASLAISLPAMERLLSYQWPGNVREAKNVMDTMAATVTGPTLQPWHLPPQVSGLPRIVGDVAQRIELKVEGWERLPTLEEVIREAERALIELALLTAKGHAPTAAGLIGISRTTFYRKLGDHGLSSNEEPAGGE